MVKARAGTTELRDFCTRLDTLHREAGGPSVDSLSRNPQVPLKRSQIYAILRGEVGEPPSWEFVKALILLCQEFARVRGNLVSLSTNLAVWRAEHSRLEAADGLHRRAQAGVNRRAVEAAQMVTAAELARRSAAIARQDLFPYRLKDTVAPDRRVVVVTGDIREVDFADVWVNSENTDMEMARFQEFSVSSIVRYGGAQRDESGRVLSDDVADDLRARTEGMRPLVPASAVVGTSGALLASNHVRHIVHVAAVHGEPGAGFTPVLDIGRCVHSALRALDTLRMSDPKVTSILFPILGAGSAGGSPQELAPAMIAAAVKHLSVKAGRDEDRFTIYFLAYTHVELAACLSALDSDHRVVRGGPAGAAGSAASSAPR